MSGAHAGSSLRCGAAVDLPAQRCRQSVDPRGINFNLAKQMNDIKVLLFYPRPHNSIHA